MNYCSLVPYEKIVIRKTLEIHQKDNFLPKDVAVIQIF